jgi:hypothetical protein
MAECMEEWILPLVPGSVGDITVKELESNYSLVVRVVS